MKNKAFSLIELLVAVSILLILLAVATVNYLKFKKSAYHTGTKSEMSEMMKMASMAKNTDGHYHQFIYQMGYRPSKTVYATIGVKASDTVNCCDQYPALASDPCSTASTHLYSDIKIFDNQACPIGTSIPDSTEERAKFKGRFCKDDPCTCTKDTTHTSYTYYNCKNDPINKAVTNVAICNADLTLSCYLSKLSSPPPLISNETFGSYEPSTWCDCNTLTIGAKSSLFEERWIIESTGEILGPI